MASTFKNLLAAAMDNRLLLWHLARKGALLAEL
jgi:hypothetical protein